MSCLQIHMNENWSRRSLSLRQQSGVWNLLRASRRLFNFTPPRRRSAELTEIEMCREESFFIKQKLCHQTVVPLAHLLSTWREVEFSLFGAKLYLLCVSCAAFSEEYTVSSGADCKWSPQATTRPSLLRSALTKAWLLQGGWQPLLLTCVFKPSPPNHLSSAKAVKPSSTCTITWYELWIWYRLCCPVFWWDEV